ncbi:hypothetical protein BD626DRAFT_395207 [Schizophyllum amplum]|uniref:Uncharacterized protein n=1 Tax=Schizophyllum amplum TaxID=97359 RepID=A0A550CUM7_9AGAR|nr:hypothetical protein BD626DRAFT_395207 [Auriculariopsis ampla]
MNTTTTARRGSQTGLKNTCDYEDWEDLKDLFQKAAEQYESEDASEALSLLRGVIHECHRFLLHYQDPSVLFSAPSPHPDLDSPPNLSPSDEKQPSDWGFDNIRSDSIRSKGCHRHVAEPQPSLTRRKCKCRELPTAFHAILGSTLFLFGNLIAQDPEAALEDEPNIPTPYWLAALDVFETGENLPKRTDGRSTCEQPEDWRMAIVWGRTLVCIAEEAIDKCHQTPSFTADEPAWPKESPFSVIAARRPPITLRMSLAGATANDLMILAMDQFSRGIFHMPHPLHAVPALPDGTDSGVATPPPTSATAADNFSRAKELYTVAHEVLLLAEKLVVPAERQYWASWADSVFEQMRMEADMDNWRGPITRMRGKCWLTFGSARLDDIETRLQEAKSSADSDAILASEAAIEGRGALEKAMEFFERALELGSRPGEDMELDRSAEDRDSLAETKALLLEAVLPLIDLTPDKAKRDDLYARAVRVGGEDVVQLLQGDPMDEDED